MVSAVTQNDQQIRMVCLPHMLSDAESARPDRLDENGCLQANLEPQHTAATSEIWLAVRMEVEVGLMSSIR